MVSDLIGGVQVETSYPFTRERSGSEKAMIFQHPDLLKEQRPTYVRAYDVYSLGVAFLEVGLWQPIERAISNVRRPNATLRSVPEAGTCAWNKIPRISPMVS